MTLSYLLPVFEGLVKNCGDMLLVIFTLDFQLLSVQKLTRREHSACNPGRPEHSAVCVFFSSLAPTVSGAAPVHCPHTHICFSQGFDKCCSLWSPLRSQNEGLPSYEMHSRNETRVLQWILNFRAVTAYFLFCDVCVRYDDTSRLEVGWLELTWSQLGMSHCQPPDRIKQNVKC